MGLKCRKRIRKSLLFNTIFWYILHTHLYKVLYNFITILYLNTKKDDYSVCMFYLICKEKYLWVTKHTLVRHSKNSERIIHYMNTVQQNCVKTDFFLNFISVMLSNSFRNRIFRYWPMLMRTVSEHHCPEKQMKALKGLQEPPNNIHITSKKKYHFIKCIHCRYMYLPIWFAYFSRKI